MNLIKLRKLIREQFLSLTEAIIEPTNFSEKFDELKNYNPNDITLKSINKLFEPVNVIFTNYDYFYDNFGDDEQKKIAPSKEASIGYGIYFALYNFYLDKMHVVVRPKTFIEYLKNPKYQNQIKDYLNLILRHESIHKKQTEKMGKDNYKLNVSPESNFEKYFSQKEEIMAYAQSAVDRLFSLVKSKEKILNMLRKGNLPMNSFVDTAKKVLSDKDFKRFIKYMYMYLEKLPNEQPKKEKHRKHPASNETINKSLNKLNVLLKKYIEVEDYEMASKIRDEINATKELIN